MSFISSFKSCLRYFMFHMEYRKNNNYLYMTKFERIKIIHYLLLIYMSTPLKNYCNSPDCKSVNKVLKTVDDIVSDHFDHMPNIKNFEALSQELQREDHPIRNLKMT